MIFNCTLIQLIRPFILYFICILRGVSHWPCFLVEQFIFHAKILFSIHRELLDVSSRMSPSITHAKRLKEKDPEFPLQLIMFSLFCFFKVNGKQLLCVLSPYSGGIEFLELVMPVKTKEQSIILKQDYKIGRNYSNE